jgi:RecG-like helicase
LRGPGDFLALSGNASIRQSGSLTFRLADMCQDTDIMTQAFDSANAIIERDPQLEGSPALKSAAERMFTMRSDIIS